MTTRVFITGVTGYVGGTVLTDLLKSNSPLSLTVLVRTSAQASKLNTVHPTVKTVIGDFNSHDLLVSTARASDIVLHIAGDFESGILSMLEGLANRPSHRKGIFIHISGSTSLIDPRNPCYGEKCPKQYSDVSDYAEIMAFSEERWHVALEHKIIRTSIGKGIKLVIVAPAMIYGNGSGTQATSTYSFDYAREVLKRGKGFLLGKGENIWSGSSVGDVSFAIIFILDEALKGLEKEGAGKIEYGWDGYYFVEAGESSMRETADGILQDLKGLGAIQETKIDELTVEEINKIYPMGETMFGSNSRSKADRLLALGWVPRDDWKSKIQESTLAVLQAFKEKGVGSAVDHTYVHMDMRPRVFDT